MAFARLIEIKLADGWAVGDREDRHGGQIEDYHPRAARYPSKAAARAVINQERHERAERRHRLAVSDSRDVRDAERGL